MKCAAAVMRSDARTQGSRSNVTVNHAGIAGSTNVTVFVVLVCESTCAFVA